MPPDKKDMTTIWVSKIVKAKLDQIRGTHSYNDALNMLLNMEAEVWFDVLSVDGEDPVGHEIIFKLGKVTYVYKDGVAIETKLKIVALSEDGETAL